MSGRTFTVYAPDEDGVHRHLPFVSVPDGKWVIMVTVRDAYDENVWDPDGLPVPNLLRGDQFEIFGPRPQEILLQGDHAALVGAGDVTWTFLLVGSESFGIVRYEYGDVWFEPARQVHKGQLGRKPPLELPEVIRESEGRRRGRVIQNPAGWVRVEDVARLVRMDPVEMLLTYYDFDRNNKDLSSGHIWIEEGTAENIRQSQAPCAHFPGRGVVGYTLKEIRENGRGEAWIRLGFAQTILYLHRFGWKATHDRRLKQRELITSLQKAAELLELEHPERASEVETWVTEIQLKLA